MNTLKKTVLALAATGMFLFPVAMFAQGSVAPGGSGTTSPPEIGIPSEIGEQSGLPQDDLPTFVASVIRWVLGLIGILLVALVVWGGTLYATSAGNEDRIETGRRVITYAFIGLAIIAASWAVSGFAIDALLG